MEEIIARYEAKSLSENTTAYWTTKDGYPAIRIVDEEYVKERRHDRPRIIGTRRESGED